MRLTWRPADAATAAGAAESHSYMPPWWAYTSAWPMTTAIAFAPAEPSLITSAPSTDAAMSAAWGDR